MDSMTNASVAEQMRLSQEQSHRGAELERRLALVTSVLLVPTLIAGIFGANTQIPGQGSWPGFLGMLLLMAGGGSLTYWAFFARGDN